MKCFILLSLLLLSQFSLAQGLGTGGEVDRGSRAEQCIGLINELGRIESELLKIHKIKYQSHQQFLQFIERELLKKVVKNLDHFGPDSHRNKQCSSNNININDPFMVKLIRQSRENKLLKKMISIYEKDLLFERGCFKKLNAISELELIKEYLHNK